MKNRKEEALAVLTKLNGADKATEEILALQVNEDTNASTKKSNWKHLFNPTLRFVLFIGLSVGILQQITGINAVFFYATSIFEQTGIGTNAAFAQSVVVGIINIVFTILVMLLIDRLGRRPLLLIGIAGMAISLSITAFGFYQATYELNAENSTTLENLDQEKIRPFFDQEYTSDVAFKNALKDGLGTQVFQQNETAILQAATTINPYLILLGILGFVASFAFSLGPVMWVMLSELFPNNIRALAIGFIGFVNSFSSWVVQQIFPWELSNLGNAATFFIYALFAAIGFFLLYKILPETKGKTLEELEKELVS